ncbi:MAG: EamA family transporter [Candidatus Levyibacteriota bacterium]|nr:MAG: EamA family transporter [Candidatus Levybacteria bacterium]
MVNDWFYIALIAPAIWALVNIIDDNLIRGVYRNPYFGTIISGFFALLPVLSVFFIPISIPSLPVIIFSFLAGFLVVSAYWFYFKALMSDSPSIIVALWTLTAAMLPFLAFVFLQETLQFKQYVGFVIILVASMILSVVNIKKLTFSKTFFFMIIASIFIAITSILEKYIYTHIDFWSGFIFISIGMGLGALFFSISFKAGRMFFKEFQGKFRKYIWIFLFSELLNILAVFFSNLAISKGPVSLVKVVEGMQPFYVLLYAIVFYPFFPNYFREATQENKLKKVLCMMIIILGLYFIYN